MKPQKSQGCQIGGCGGPGMCPGIALMLSVVAGSMVSGLSGSSVLGWAVGGPLFVALVLGVRGRLLARFRGRQG